MAKNLVIVESPAKATTIERYLGKDFQVVASFGHVRDLPKSKLGIDVEHNFTPQYMIPRGSAKKINQLKNSYIAPKQSTWQLILTAKERRLPGILLKQSHQSPTKLSKELLFQKSPSLPLKKP